MAVDVLRIWDMVQNLVKSNAEQKACLFKDHVEPLHTQLLEIHKDYLNGFAEVRKHLADGSTPTPALVCRPPKLDSLVMRAVVYRESMLGSRSVPSALHDACANTRFGEMAEWLKAAVC